MAQDRVKQVLGELRDLGLPRTLTMSEVISRSHDSRRGLLACGGWRPEMLLMSYGHLGQLPQYRLTQPQGSEETSD